jgi:phosphatidylserine/phosphatidylglycerophosphate/cardiolipin synthase-like enzyme
VTARLDEWFLTADERGNSATALDRRRPGAEAWTTGNLVTPLIHGASYFARLVAEVQALQAGDRLYFTDWRGDPDERLTSDGPTVGELLSDAARRGVRVYGLVWRSHSDLLSFSASSNRVLDRDVNAAGGCAVLDQRVRMGGSHHQKMAVLRHRDDPERDVAFVGGIDLCYSRRDDARHEGDPQQQPMDRRYGKRAPWHDVQLELHGPAVGDLVWTFLERWNDHHRLDRRSPVSWFAHLTSGETLRPPPLVDTGPAPPPAGSAAVQILRTYGLRHPRYPFAPYGERSIARALIKAFARARRLIYVEDQYLWSDEVAAVIGDALARNSELRFIAVVPRYPDADGALMGPPNRIGQIRAIDRIRQAGGDRVGIFDIENHRGNAIYVHAKVCVIDDVWAMVGSSNLNRRSWTHDSEVAAAVLDLDSDGQPLGDSAGSESDDTFARRLRLDLWGEHLGIPANDARMVDLTHSLDLWRAAACETEAGNQLNELGQPRQRVQAHRPAPVRSSAHRWAWPLYRVVFDPDGRPRTMRRPGQF